MWVKNLSHQPTETHLKNGASLVTLGDLFKLMLVMKGLSYGSTQPEQFVFSSMMVMNVCCGLKR